MTPTTAMQVSWIDEVQFEALLEELREALPKNRGGTVAWEVHTLPVAAAVDPAELPRPILEEPPPGALPPDGKAVEMELPEKVEPMAVSPEIDRIRGRLQEIRERAQAAGLLARTMLGRGAVAEPDATPPDAAAEPVSEGTVEPVPEATSEVVAEPEMVVQPEVAAEPERVVEPEAVSEPEVPVEVKLPEKVVTPVQETDVPEEVGASEPEALPVEPESALEAVKEVAVIESPMEVEAEPPDEPEAPEGAAVEPPPEKVIRPTFLQGDPFAPTSFAAPLPFAVPPPLSPPLATAEERGEEPEVEVGPKIFPGALSDAAAFADPSAWRSSESAALNLAKEEAPTLEEPAAGVDPSLVETSETEEPAVEADAAEPMEDDCYFEVPLGTVVERLDAFADWAQKRVGDEGEVLLVDEYGDLLWGPQARAGLVLSTMLAASASHRSSAATAWERAAVTHQSAGTEGTLSVITCRTVVGVLHLAVLQAEPVPEGEALLLRQALLSAIDADL
ncbi:MAG: hypothetical protein KDK99_20415 [Verrucomicrobiales bacterium]|nr:hypothetical protein [Verrucomicrobiales bacterium]